ncbi:MAG TPA: flagellar biosynthesis anti-sigma factor FlgM [Fimbriimonadaceae bacterium]|nr:flagellar biosynthesis anti-sigma factor FlgM [Fimbriimonadaceae bacterium]HRJ33997.1 flagellar biosynthesis anti-sigma factor FlgM [Fimbriimonadaceae bacterium]
MRISDEQVKKAVDRLLHPELHPESEPTPRPEDGPMIEEVVQKVMQMPDREDRIAELKAAIESGEYRPTGSEIAESMIRRWLADQVR